MSVSLGLHVRNDDNIYSTCQIRTYFVVDFDPCKFCCYRMSQVISSGTKDVQTRIRAFYRILPFLADGLSIQ